MEDLSHGSVEVSKVREIKGEDSSGSVSAISSSHSKGRELRQPSPCSSTVPLLKTESHLDDRKKRVWIKRQQNHSLDDHAAKLNVANEIIMMCETLAKLVFGGSGVLEEMLPKLVFTGHG
ncbi:unnamed protein product [Citrullus colocynthis]|uniref:Uncharacterized protein n=1 Tax=Citrullus colocynthis TaxID=252529 RepID=A0ABP0YHR4_9ROSI